MIFIIIYLKEKVIYLLTNIHYKDFYNFYNNQREFKRNHLILF